LSAFLHGADLIEHHGAGIVGRRGGRRRVLDRRLDRLLRQLFGETDKSHSGLILACPTIAGIVGGV